ncbi:MAG: class I SAM-dependent methyltransferase [Phycisphaerales bacterium]|nr:class I SAM-dependent methyltransferase [Phycisphaerales bacterium]
MTGAMDDLTRQIEAHGPQYPRARRAIERFTTLGGMFRAAVRDMTSAYGETFFRRAEERVAEIDHLVGNDPAKFDDAVRAYIKFCMEFIRKQAVFLKTGSYAFRDFDSMQEDLYDNDEAMEEFYLPALMFSFIFSPNYYEFYDFFQKEFVPDLPREGVIAEIGCGHGVYLCQSLLSAPGATGFGIDVAPGALKVARRVMDFHGVGPERCELAVDDLRGGLARSDGCADRVICCEVLEHFPAPPEAIGELKRIMAPQGKMMVSAAVRMESVDHLYVFRTYQEVAEMMRLAGLRIIKERIAPLAKGDMRDAEERMRLANDPKTPVGYICIAEHA